MNKTAKRYVTFGSLPTGAVFRVVKESSRTKRAVPGYPATTPEPEKGLFVKEGPGVSRSYYTKAKTIILALGDIVEILPEPKKNLGKKR